MVKCEICEKETDSIKTLDGENLCESCYIKEVSKRIGYSGCGGCGGGCWCR